MTIKAAIFDMDGLMIDTEHIYCHAWDMTAIEMGYPFTESYYLKMTGLTDVDTNKILLKDFGIDFPLKKFWKVYRKHWDQYVLQNGIPRKPGLLDLLDLLETNEIPKAIATSTVLPIAEVCLVKTGLDTGFKCIVSGDQIAQGKPAPDIYQAVAKKLGIPPENCLAFEDSNAGIISAVGAGMTAIMVPDIVQPTDAVKEKAFCVVSSLHEAYDIVEKLIAV